MKKIAWLIFYLIPVLINAQQVNIIPQPASMKSISGEFTIKNTSVIVVEHKELMSSAIFLQNYLNKFYRLNLKISSKSSISPSIVISLMPELIRADGRKIQSYSLNIQEKSFLLAGTSPEAVFNGIQTIIQLLPLTTSNIKIPCVQIHDEPNFEYRGMHLDVGRHFFPISFVKKYIDYLALHKMNYFHWHLTEDQGWRIEIKKYPNLTKTGGWRNGTIIGRYPGTGSDNTPHGGFYTQEQIKEVVKYAAERFITVVPEIEMPGHCSAAIAAYPWLSCFPTEPTKIPANMISKRSVDEQAKGRIKLVQETWGVFDDVYCAGKDSTFSFMQDVLDEVLALFPSKYIHVGGDECPKANWKRCPLCQKRMKDEGLKDEHELQSYFIQRMEKYLNSRGRTLIGWDEILEGGLAPKAVVMSWRGEEGGIAAARQKHDVIMTPGGWCYFDHSQSQNEDSVTIGGYTSIEKVYSYKPVPDSLTQEQGKYVLGAQANVWTEYMSNERKVEYMIFPRMAALSEVLWSKTKDWSDFEKRLQTQFKRYDLWKANYSKAYFDLKTSLIPTQDHNGISWKLESKISNPKIFVGEKTQNGQNVAFVIPGKPVLIHESKVMVAELIDPDKGVLSHIERSIHFNKATGKNITLTTAPSQNYPGDGAFTLVNGVQNEKGLARSTEFLGFNGGDCEAVIDLGTAQQISNVKAHIFEQTESWIWRPKYFQVLISPDDKTYTEMGMTDVLQFNDATNRNAVMTVQQKSVAARYIKIKLGNYASIPDGNPGAGNKPWLFIDEIEIN